MKTSPIGLWYRLWPLLLSASLLLAACGTGGGGGGNTSGSVNTPGGTVRVNLQGGTFIEGPTLATVNPQGYQTPYGGIAFTARVPQAGGTLTVTLTFPQDLPQGAVLLKCLNGNCTPIQGAQLSGRTAILQVRDGGPLDADGQANGQIRDPVALGVPNPDFGVSLDPTSLAIPQGGSRTTQLTLTPQNGFTGQVSLTLEQQDGSPAPQGITLSPTSLNVSGTSPVTQALTIQVAQGVATGTYNLRVKATAGNISKTANLSVTVEASSQPSPGEAGGALQTLATEIQQVIQELENTIKNLLPQQPSVHSFALVQGSLSDTLGSLAELRLESILSVKPQGLYPLATSSLPRGKIECIGGNCNQVGPSDDLEMRFKQQATDPWNKLLADWNASTRGTPSPTVETHPPYNTQDTMETPTRAFFAVDFGENGSNEGEATFTANWRPSTCLSGKYLLEPVSLSLRGFLDHPTTSQRLVDLTDLSFTTSSTRLDFAWNLSLLVQGNDSALHTEGQVVINGTSTPGTCGSLLENFNASSGEVSVDLSTRTKSLHLEFRVTQVEENPVRIHIQNGLLRVDSKVVTFEGILDDQNNNCIPGENLTLHFAGGQTMNLEDFLIQHMGAQPCNQP